MVAAPGDVVWAGVVVAAVALVTDDPLLVTGRMLTSLAVGADVGRGDGVPVGGARELLEPPAPASTSSQYL